MTYIEFEMPISEQSDKQKNRISLIFQSLIIRILRVFIPTANPDFEDMIDDVKFWLIEFDDKTGIPEREIGLNKEKKVIVIMPNDRNYGFWTDNNMKLADFKERFKVSEITETQFQKYWNTYAEKFTYE